MHPLFWLPLLVLLLIVQPVYAFYDAFENREGIRASDELEERLWAETALLRPTLLQGQRSQALDRLQDAVRAHFKREFGELAPAVRVYVYDEPELTVVTTPGGELFISTGLLLRVRSDEELSVLLAREVAHVVNRDAARTLSYAKLGANLKEIFSTTFAAYNVATGLVSASSFVNSFSGLSPEGVLSKLQITPEKLLEGGGKMFADYLKNGLQDSIKESARDAGKSLAGQAVHRLSVQAVAALIKTSVYGYSERMEKQADEFALRYLQGRYGNTAAYASLMQRLLDQAKVRSFSYLTFYANTGRLEGRIASLNDFRLQGDIPQMAHKDMALRLGLLAAGGSLPMNVAVGGPVAPSADIANDPLHVPVLAPALAAGAVTDAVTPAALPALDVVPLPALDVVPVRALEFAPVIAMSPADTASESADASATGVSAQPASIEGPAIATPHPPPAGAVSAEATDSASPATASNTREASVHATAVTHSEFMRALAAALPELILREARDSEPARFLHLTSQTLPAPLAWPDDLELIQTDILLKRGAPGDQEKAAALLAHRVESHPDDWRSAKQAAQVYFRLKDFDTALMFFEKALINVTDERERVFLVQARDRAARRIEQAAVRK